MDKQQLRVIESDWIDCKRCPLGEKAFKHVLWEIPDPDKPIDVLFIGEGPGEGEDIIGRPFIGKAGKLLRRVLREAGFKQFNVAYSNLVACRPQDFRDGKNRPPEPLEIETCNPRLRGLIDAVNPLSICALGRVPEQWVMYTLQEIAYQGKYFSNTHPSAVIRKKGQERVEAESEYREQFVEIGLQIRELRVKSDTPKPPTGVYTRRFKAVR